MFEQKTFLNYSQQLHFEKLERYLIDLQSQIKFSGNGKPGQKKYKLLKCMQLLKEVGQFYLQAGVKYLFDFTLKLVDNIAFLFNEFVIPEKPIISKKISSSTQTDKSSFATPQNSKRLLGRFGGIILNNEYCHHCKMANDKGNIYNEENQRYKKQLQQQQKYQNQLKNLISKQQRSRVCSSGLQFKIQQIIETMNISFSQIQLFLGHFSKQQRQYMESSTWLPNYLKKVIDKYMHKALDIFKEKNKPLQEKLLSLPGPPVLTLNSQIIKQQIIIVAKKYSTSALQSKKQKKKGGKQKPFQTVQCQTLFSGQVIPIKSISGMLNNSYNLLNSVNDHQLNSKRSPKKKLNLAICHPIHFKLQFQKLSSQLQNPISQMVSSENYILNQQNANKIQYSELKKQHKKYRQVVQQNQNYRLKLQICEEKLKLLQSNRANIFNTSQTYYHNNPKDFYSQEQMLNEMFQNQKNIEKVFKWFDKIAQFISHQDGIMDISMKNNKRYDSAFDKNKNNQLYRKSNGNRLIENSNRQKSILDSKSKSRTSGQLKNLFQKGKPTSLFRTPPNIVQQQHSSHKTLLQEQNSNQNFKLKAKDALQTRNSISRSSLKLQKLNNKSATGLQKKDKRTSNFASRQDYLIDQFDKTSQKFLNNAPSQVNKFTSSIRFSKKKKNSRQQRNTFYEYIINVLSNLDTNGNINNDRILTRGESMTGISSNQSIFTNNLMSGKFEEFSSQNDRKNQNIFRNHKNHKTNYSNQNILINDSRLQRNTININNTTAVNLKKYQPERNTVLGLVTGYTPYIQASKNTEQIPKQQQNKIIVEKSIVLNLNQKDEKQFHKIIQKFQSTPHNSSNFPPNRKLQLIKQNIHTLLSNQLYKHSSCQKQIAQQSEQPKLCKHLKKYLDFLKYLSSSEDQVLQILKGNLIKKRQSYKIGIKDINSISINKRES